MIQTMNPPQAEAAIEVGYPVATKSAKGVEESDIVALQISLSPLQENSARKQRIKVS